MVVEPSWIRQFEISNEINLELCWCLRQNCPSNEEDRSSEPFIPGLALHALANGMQLSPRRVGLTEAGESARSDPDF